MSVPEKIPSGIPGLDRVLSGGFPRARLYLLQGTPGAGKTTMALQILLEAARRGEKCLYITLAETKEELSTVAESHAWTLDGLEITELSAISEEVSAKQNTLFHASEIELMKMMELLLDAAKRVNPSMLVVDSLSEMRLLAQNPYRFRQQVLAFKQFVSQQGCTVWVLDDWIDKDTEQQLESVAHGVIRLSIQPPSYGAERRQLTVTKLRGVKYIGGMHDYRILTGGVRVFPRIVAAEHRAHIEMRAISSGIPNLDSLSGGGIDLGTSTVLMGPAGTGKSTMAVQWVVAALERQQKALYFTFDETVDLVIKRAESLKLDLRKHLDSGALTLRQIDPAEVSAGELADYVRQAVEEEQVTVLVIDSLNGYVHAMPNERFLTLLLHELLMFLNQHGVATILVLTQQGLVGQMSSSIELTYLADMVVILRYFECAGEVRQAISVVKKRSGIHERTIREFVMKSDGIHVGDALRDFEGILTGVPEYKGATEQMMDH